MTFPVLTFIKCPQIFICTFGMSIQVSRELSSAFPECLSIFRHVCCLTSSISASQETAPHTTERREGDTKRGEGMGEEGTYNFQHITLLLESSYSWVKIAPPQSSSLQWCPSLQQDVVSPVITTVGFSSRICLQILRAPRMDTG